MAIRTLFILVFLTKAVWSQSEQSIDSLIDTSWEKSNESLEGAIQIIDQALLFAHQKKYKKGIASASSHKAVYLDLNGKPTEAVKLFNQAIEIQKELKDSMGLSFSYNNLGLLYFAQYDYSQAQNYLQKSLLLDLNMSDSLSAAGSLVNLGIILSNMDSMDKALSYYTQAEEIYQSAEDTLMIFIARSNKAKILYYKGDYEASLKIYDQVFNYLHQIPGKYPEKITNLISKANCYLKLNRFQEGLSCAEKAIQLSEDHSLPERLLFAYEIYHELLYSSGDYKKSYEILIQHDLLKDSLVNIEKTEAITDLQLKYDIAEKNKIISEQALNSQLEKTKNAELELKNKAFIFRITMLIGALALVVIIAIILWITVRQKSKINELLKERNEAIRKNLEQKEVMLGETHHRIKNNLQLISSILDMKVRSLKDPSAVESLNDAIRRVESVAILHRFLYLQSDPEHIKLDVFLDQLSDEMLAGFNYTQKTIAVNTNIAEETTNLSLALPIGLIVVELITNTFKYARNENQKIEILITLERKGALHLTFEDNGQGIQQDFEILKAHSFGFKMINSLTRQLKGKWTLDQSNGTKHHFVFSKT